jgi:hypothetical protein
VGTSIGDLGPVLVSLPIVGSDPLPVRSLRRGPSGPAESSSGRCPDRRLAGVDGHTALDPSPFGGRAVPCLSPAGKSATIVAWPRFGAGAYGRCPAGIASARRSGITGPIRNPAELAALTAGVASRPERAISFSVVGWVSVDVTGVDRWTPSDRHQPGSADRTILTVAVTAVVARP